MKRSQIDLDQAISKRIHFSWIIYAILSAGGTALMATCVRIASFELPQSEIVFFRNFLGLILLLPLAVNKRLSLRTSRLGLHLIRAIFGFATMYLYFYAISQLPLADAVILVYTYPLFVSFFAFMILGEQLNKNRKVSIIVGFIGVCCLFHPSSAIASIAGLLGLLSGISAGIAQISIKKLSTTEPGLLIVIFFAIFGSAFSLVPMLFEFVMPDFENWMVLMAIGCLGNLSQLSLTHAYKLAPASQVAPLGYSALVFAGLIGFLFWNEIPDYWMLIGTVFVVVAGTLVAREQVEL
jgi:drug/metabolite transporter (DMT)-like permease